MIKKSKKTPKAPLPFSPTRGTRSSFTDPPVGWSSDTPSIWLFPIHWFASDVEELDFGVSKVRRLSADDLEAMRAVEDRPTLGLFSRGQQRWDDFTEREWPWVLDVTVPANDFDKAEPYAEYLRRCAEGVLLIAGGRYVWISDAVVYQPGVEKSLEGPYRLSRGDPEIPAWIQYRLTAELGAALKTMHRAAMQPVDDRARIALRRFYIAYGRSDDDAVIDLWIGLEALASDRDGEVTYKAAMRIAHYIGQGAAARRFLFRALKKSYKVRSDMVHGDHPAQTGPAMHVAAEALRQALRKVLLAGAVPDSDELDGAITGADG